MIAVNKSVHCSKILSQNAVLFNVRDQLECLEADFLDLRLRASDIVFFAPCVPAPRPVDEPELEEVPFSLFDHVVPDVVAVLCKAFESSHNVVMVLPRKLDLTELALLFGRCFERRRAIAKVAVRIEYFKVNCRLERYIVYFGDVAEVPSAKTRSSLCEGLRGRGARHP